VGQALDVPPLRSLFLSFRLASITFVNRDASGNVVIGIDFLEFALDLDYNSSGQLTAATVLGIPNPVDLL
jgi:hypothetical protein